jgi:hypothetical protein
VRSVQSKCSGSPVVTSSVLAGQAEPSEILVAVQVYRRYTSA